MSAPPPSLTRRHVAYVNHRQKSQVEIGEKLAFSPICLPPSRFPHPLHSANVSLSAVRPAIPRCGFWCAEVLRGALAPCRKMGAACELRLCELRLRLPAHRPCRGPRWRSHTHTHTYIHTYTCGTDTPTTTTTSALRTDRPNGQDAYTWAARTGGGGPEEAAPRRRPPKT